MAMMEGAKVRVNNVVGGGALHQGAMRRPRKTDLLRQSIEAKLRENLTPIAAKRALDELRPLLAELDDDLMVPVEPPPRIRGPTSTTTATKQNSQRAYMDTPHSRRKRNQNAAVLPSITSILAEHYSKRSADAGNNNHAAGSPAGSLPRGARSATSDTLSVTRVKVPPRATSSTTEQAMERIRGKLAGHTQPTYNAPAALSLMRLERNTRKPDFSAFWNWKDDASSSEADMETRRGQMKAQLEREVADYLGTTAVAKPPSPATRQKVKVDRVQQMKLTYFHGDNAGTTSAPHAVGDVDIDVDEECTSANYTGPFGHPKGPAHLDPFQRGAQRKAAAAAASTGGAAQAPHRPMMQHGGGPPPIRGVDAPLTDADMAAVYKYFMTDEDSRPTTGGVGQHVAAMHDHQAAAAAVAVGAEHAAARVEPPRVVGGRPLPALQVGLAIGLTSPPQQGSPVNDGSLSILFSRKSSDMVAGPWPGPQQGVGQDALGQRESPDGLSRLTSPVAGVDSLLDWTRSLDPNLF